jgi:hypothetical protein
MQTHYKLMRIKRCSYHQCRFFSSDAAVFRTIKRNRKLRGFSPQVNRTIIICIFREKCLYPVRGSIVGWSIMQQAGMWQVRIPVRYWFFNWPQPLTEMSTRSLPGCKWRPARKADILTTICESIVEQMWKPRRLTTVGLRAPLQG